MMSYTICNHIAPVGVLPMKSPSRRRRRTGFTLIEVLLVLAILVILAASAVPLYSKIFGHGQADVAKVSIRGLKTAVKVYQLQVGSYPPSLDALFQPVGDAGGKWDGPYVESQKSLNDPWDKPFQYACPGQHGQEFDIWTVSPDGKDIGSWD
jgi:general secretion pathway protein G